MIAGALGRLFGGNVSRDGQAPALEEHATGLDLTQIATLAEAAGAGAGRRQRPLADPRAALETALSQKVLHAWLQNRHQTLFPLSVNLRNLEPDKAAVLARMAALAGLAATSGRSDALARARAWLDSVGADAHVRDAFEQASGDEPALTGLLLAVQDAGIGAYAYVAALVALDSRDPAASPFLEYLAARLAVPATVVRSANRRYRR